MFQTDFIPKLFVPDAGISRITVPTEQLSLFLGNYPRVYGFSHRKLGNDIILDLHIHDGVWNPLWRYLGSRPEEVQYATARLGNGQLSRPTLGQPVGIYNILNYEAYDGEFHTLSVPASKVGGRIFALMASYWVLIGGIRRTRFDSNKESNRYQSFEAELLPIESLGGGSLSIILAPYICDDIRRNDRETRIPEVEEFMYRVYKSLWEGYFETPIPKGVEYEFRCKVERGSVKLDVWGNACDLALDEHTSNKPGSGQRLHPHNIDDSFEQLSLLFGVAAFCNRYEGISLIGERG